GRCRGGGSGGVSVSARHPRLCLLDRDPGRRAGGQVPLGARRRPHSTALAARSNDSKFKRRTTMRFQKTSVAIAVSLALGCVGNAHADQASDMQAKLDALQKEIQELQAQIGALRKKQEQAAPAAAAAPAKAPANEVKAGKELIFKVGGGEVQLYGHADVSLDDQTNGMTGFIHNGLPVTGHNGWVPDVSSNLSFFGVRGNRAVSDDLKGVFQFETEISY